jgi:signal transduction histidine kinase
MPSVYDHLLTPIANILITSEALSNGAYGALTDAQCENMQIIHSNAVDTYTLTQRTLAELNDGNEDCLQHLTHDWLAPSATLISYCDFMMEGMAGELAAAALQKIRQIYYQGHQLRRQIYNLLDYGRILRSDYRPVATFDVRSILYPDLIIIDTPVPMQWNIPRDLPLVYSSKLYIARAVSNLLANACAYTEHGYILTRAIAEDGIVVISVRDTGAGIPHQHWNEIFLPHVRYQPQIAGSGLGLFIARTFIEWQGGTLTVESVIGEGSTFTLTIPISMDEPHAEAG